MLFKMYKITKTSFIIYCSQCGANYDEDDYPEAWIGCDNEECGRWYHYWCAGFKKKPTSRKKFTCIKLLLDVYSYHQFIYIYTCATIKVIFLLQYSVYFVILLYHQFVYLSKSFYINQINSQS